MPGRQDFFGEFQGLGFRVYKVMIPGSLSKRISFIHQPDDIMISTRVPGNSDPRLIPTSLHDPKYIPYAAMVF